MARGPKKWDEATIERMYLEGRGKGQGRHYKPWIGVLEFSSRGRSRRVAGVKTGREHQLFSDVEWGLFLLLEWARNVIDIREQFPLDRELTLEIAAMLRIRHPVYPGTKVPAVMRLSIFSPRKNAMEAAVSWPTTPSAPRKRKMPAPWKSWKFSAITSKAKDHPTSWFSLRRSQRIPYAT